MVNSALVVVDLQEDFLPPNGALSVQGGREIIPGINALVDISRYPWKYIVATQDWHPSNHISFASQHKANPFTEIDLRHPEKAKDALGQVMTKKFTVWPDHCVQNTPGASLEKLFEHVFKTIHGQVPTILTRKGYLQDREYYLCLKDTWDCHHTELEGLLKKAQISHVVLVGLAYDFCVLNSAIDFAKTGFVTFVISDLTRSVHPEQKAETDAAYKDAGVAVLQSAKDLPDWIFGQAGN